MRIRVEPLREVAMLRGLQEQAAAAAAGEAQRETARARRAFDRSGAHLGGLRDAWEAALGDAGDFEGGMRWSAAWHRQAADHESDRAGLAAASETEAARRADWAHAIALQDVADTAHKAAAGARAAARDEAAMHDAAERHVTRMRMRP